MFEATPGDGRERWNPQTRSSRLVFIGAALLLFCRAAALAQAQHIHNPASPRTLTSIIDLKLLHSEQARQGLPVHVRAVVTYFDEYSPDLFVQDKTGGIWVVWDSSKPKPKIGDVLDLTGFSAQHDFAPEINDPRWTLVGHAPLPHPKKLTYRDLVNTSKDSMWVQAEGVVRQMSYMPLVPNKRSLWMNVALTGSVGILDVQIPWDGSPIPSSYVDARIRILGVDGAEFNARHQQTGGVLYSPSLKFITVLEPAPKDQFAQETDLVGRLQTFGYQRPFEHRVKVAGTVTAVTRNSGFFIQDPSGGIFVESREWYEVSPGDQVETLGFLKVYEAHLRLENAIIRKLGRNPEPKPADITVGRELAGKFDSQLIATTGKIIGHSNVGSMSALLVEQNGTTFPVVVGEHSPAINLPLGTIIRAVGVTADEWDFFGRVTSFKILTRSRRDVTVIRKAPWWSIWYLVISLAVLAAITLLILAWVVVLRRRVQEQTQVISQKLAEQESLRQEAQLANKARGEFLANMSHEIRTPMNGVLGMTQAALETSLTKEQREYLEIAKSSADSLLTIVNDILDFSKIEAGKLNLDPVPIELRSWVGNVLKPLAFRATEKDLELLCSISSSVPVTILADGARLSQVVTNLVGNAVKFTEAGEVELSIEAEPIDAVCCRLHFCVRDTGIGISEERHGAIFEAFSQADNSTTRRFGGTGLGLTISARLVQLMGGRVWVKSKLGLGSEFHFTVQTGILEANASVNTLESFGARPISVLIVDRNARSREVLTHLSACCGVNSVAVSCTTEAVEVLSASLDHFDAVLMDERLPDMDGISLLDRMKQDIRVASLPVIMLCSPGRHRYPARGSELEVAARLSKPVIQPQFEESLRAVLDRTGTQASELPSGSITSVHSAAAERLRILLAEDNPVNQKVAARLLEKLGHTVTVVKNGKDAVELAEPGSFDVVLMDVQMPGMDGLEATAAIRDREGLTGDRIPIIALTAHAMSGDRERCLASGMDGYVSKPIQTQEIIREIVRVRDLALENSH